MGAGSGESGRQASFFWKCCYSRRSNNTYTRGSDFPLGGTKLPASGFVLPASGRRCPESVSRFSARIRVGRGAEEDRVGVGGVPPLASALCMRQLTEGVQLGETILHGASRQTREPESCSRERLALPRSSAARASASMTRRAPLLDREVSQTRSVAVLLTGHHRPLTLRTVAASFRKTGRPPERIRSGKPRDCDRDFRSERGSRGTCASRRHRRSGAGRVESPQARSRALSGAEKNSSS